MADLFEEPEGTEARAPSPFSGEPGGATEAARAKIGRPVGARNRRDLDAERWYYAMGYQDPMQRLAEIISEDPRVLLAWFAEHGEAVEVGPVGQRKLVALGVPTLLEVVEMQVRAAGELMPYLHGKKTPDVTVAIEALPTLIIAAGINQLDQARGIAERRALSVGVAIAAPPGEGEASEIKGLAGGAASVSHVVASHDVESDDGSGT